MGEVEPGSSTEATEAKDEAVETEVAFLGAQLELLGYAPRPGESLNNSWSIGYVGGMTDGGIAAVTFHTGEKIDPDQVIPIARHRASRVRWICKGLCRFCGCCFDAGLRTRDFVHGR